MLSDAELEALLPLFQKQMDEVNRDYIERIALHVRQIGELAPSDINRLTEMKRVRSNMTSVKRHLARALKKNIHNIDLLLWKAAGSNMEFAEQLFGLPAVPVMSLAMKQLVNAQVLQTKGAMENLAKTTLNNKAYRKAVDIGIRAVQTGVGDYRSAVRTALNRASLNGLQVVYPSGAHRRADTAVRQNILDGVRQMNNIMLDQLGKEYGANGIEISAHMLCAEDHLPYQGRQYTQKEFDDLQSNLDRKFGQWNCRHYMFPIILGVSRRGYTDEQIAKYGQNSTEQITIDGRTMSRYEWTQEQRRLETAIRWEKDAAVAASTSRDDEYKRAVQRRIDDLDAKYISITKAAGLSQNERYRQRVEGWRRFDD